MFLGWVTTFLGPIAVAMLSASQTGTSKCRFPFELSDMLKTVECVVLHDAFLHLVLSMGQSRKSNEFIEFVT